MRESEKKTMEMESNVKTIRVGDRILDLSRPAVMAIVNVTPDSFFAGSRTAEAGAVRERVRRAVAEGASIIDVGGYSSRPGAADVPAEEELRRVSLAVEAVRDEYPETLVSVDTFRASVAEGVMARFGPCIVNDISAGELDSGIMEVAARYGVPYIAMHMRGTPADMQGRTAYGDIVGEVAGYLAGGWRRPAGRGYAMWCSIPVSGLPRLPHRITNCSAECGRSLRSVVRCWPVSRANR